MKVNNTNCNSNYVFYKYPFEKNPSCVSFVGETIRASELRELIYTKEEKQKNLSFKVQRRNRDFIELYKLTEDGTSEEPYKNDDLIESLTQVAIKRVNKSILNCIPTYVSDLFAHFNIELLEFEKIAPILDESVFFLVRPNDLNLLNKIITSKTYYVKLAWIMPYLQSKSIVLLFATHGAGRFQGYAKVTSFNINQAGNVKMNLKWLRINELHFTTVTKVLKDTSMISHAAFSKASSQEALKICELFETSINWYDWTKGQVQKPTIMPQVVAPQPRIIPPCVDDEPSTSLSSEEGSSGKLNKTFLCKDMEDFSTVIEKDKDVEQNKFISKRDPRAKLYEKKVRGDRERSRSKSPSGIKA